MAKINHVSQSQWPIYLLGVIETLGFTLLKDTLGQSHHDQFIRAIRAIHPMNDSSGRAIHNAIVRGSLVFNQFLKKLFGFVGLRSRSIRPYSKNRLTGMTHTARGLSQST